MKSTDLKQAVEAVFAFRPDEAYTVEEILDLWCAFKVKAYSVKCGEVIFKAGSPAKKVVFVTSGALHLKTPSDIGEDILVATVGPGEYVGLPLLYTKQTVYPHDVVAVADSEIVVFNAKRLRDWRSDPRSIPFFTHIGASICHQLAEARRKSVVVGGVNIAERVRRYCAIRMFHNKSRTIAIPGTEVDFANYLGVNSCALSRALNLLVAAGKITYKRNVITVLESF